MPYKKNIRYLYFIALFDHLILVYAIERLFALERGMTLQMIVYTEIIFAVITVALEIPSGVLADRFGRKHLLVIGAICACFEFFVLIFAYGIWLFILSALIAAVGNTCTSGARNALLYDSLQQCGMQNEYEKILGRLRILNFGAALVAALCGGVFARIFDLTFNYYISVGSMGIALFFTCRLTEPPASFVMEEKAEPTIPQIISAAARFFRSHLDVLWIIVYSTSIAAAYTYVDEFWQVYLNSIAFPIALFGVISAMLTLAQIPGAMMAAKLLRFMRHKTIILFSSIVAAIGALWAAFSQNIWGIAGIAAVAFSIALMEPIVSGYIHHRADSTARATIESVSSMVERAFSIVLGLLFGYISTKYSIFEGFWFIGFFLSGILIVFVAFVVKRGKQD